ncbi:MAG: SHOCT domain-containing protein [Desulfovibrio sp.]|nr:SHOCT domain-containing protein [Desulfovibrio sp.]
MFKLFFTMVMAIVAACFVIGFIVRMLRKGGHKEVAEIGTDIAKITGGEGDKVWQLQELAKLREQKILTEEEFDQQKKKILDQ